MSTSITATTDNDATDLSAGHVVTITVTTGDPAIVTGTPTLTLSNNQVASYTGGSETNTLTFGYTVQAGDDTADLQVTGLDLPNGALIQLGDGSLLNGVAQDLELEIDTTPPSVPPFPQYSTIVDPSGVYSTNTFGINNAGQLVGNYYDSNFTSHGFVESGGNFTTIDDPLAAQDTVTNGINDTGQVAGYYADANNIGHSFVYSDGNFTAIDDPLATNGTYAFGINDSGQTVGYYVDANNIGHSFLYGDGNFTTIDDPLAAHGAYAFGINDAGQVVGYYYDANSIGHGFLYSGGNYTTIDEPSSAGGTYAFGINDAGQIVGNYLDSNFNSHGFIYSGDNFTTIDNPLGIDTAPTGINGTGEIVGSYDDSVSGYGFVLSPPTPPLVPVVATPVGGDVSGGQTVTITVSMTEPVVVDGGTPALTLNDGGSANYDAAATAALSDTTKLVFDYIAGATDTKVSALAVTGVNLNGATVQDLAGNNADFSGADVTFNDLAVICFMPGTMISTPGGRKTVETLERGDLILTTDGRASPVRWIGRQTISTRFADPLRVLPIRIRAGAIGENVPSRDFLLSPDHAIRVDGVLIQAGALVNGVSIIRETSVPQTFTYYHVELDDHSLILAENTPAETFVDNVDRLAFDNWHEYEALYPERKPIIEMPYPRAKAHRQVPRAIRESLIERAGTLTTEPHEAAA